MSQCNCQVKQSAFLAVLSLLDFFPAAERTKRILPELLCLAESQPEYIAELFAKHFGHLATKLALLSHLGPDTAPVLLQSYAKLCVKEDPLLRQCCAYNFPAVVKAFGAQYVPLLMDDLLVKLASDSDDHVRTPMLSKKLADEVDSQLVTNALLVYTLGAPPRCRGSPRSCESSGPTASASLSQAALGHHDAG